MAWFRTMGADSVAYHAETVLGRGDDHPGRALAYYVERGETPLRWGNTQAAGDLGLVGEVTPEAYEAAFGVGGFRHPLSGERLAKTTRPGFELVVAAHKTTAVLGVIGRASDMHAILDSETEGTMRWLDGWFSARGGRRGEAATPTPTTGLVYAQTRHGTSRAGDPAPHDHVLIANICEMLDDRGGHKALFSALLRDTTEAATMVGRLHSAARAVELGYAIEPDDGESGRLRHWRIRGIPTEVTDIFSKRADDIADYLQQSGYQGYRARGIAARATRSVKRGTGVDELMPRWIAELEQLGWTPERLTASLDTARVEAAGLKPSLSNVAIEQLTAELFDSEGEFLTRWKVFSRTRLIAEIAPKLYGHDPVELERVIDHILAGNDVVPLVGLAGAREQAYTTAQVLATEQAIADRVEALATRPAAAVPAQLVQQVIATKETDIGGSLSDGQRDAVTAICRSGRAFEIVVGVAGAGKTTALHAARDALENAGHIVVGTATSGQAARTLGRETDLASSSTMRSLLWRLHRSTLTLTPRTVVVLDEAAMTADTDLLGLLGAVQRAGAKVVLVGDPRQLSPVGPGGALAAVLERHPQVVTTLAENMRQHDPAERAALAELRDGDLDTAIDFYLANDRVHIAGTRTEALGAMVDAWAADTQAGHDTLLLAWRRDSVAGLNRLARAKADQLGWLDGPDLQAPGGRHYAVGDPVVLLAPNHRGRLVTSQRGTITHVDQQTQTLTLVVDDGRRVPLSGEEIDNKHLDHGYAMTVHRQQGATADRAHVFADGGGRELGYVALSRARHHTAIHAAADDLDQAIDDLRYDWSQSRAQRWVSRTHQPGIDHHLQPTRPATPARPVTPPAATGVLSREERRADLLTELETLQQAAPPEVTAELATARTEVHQLNEDLRALTHGQNRRTETSLERRLTARRDTAERRVEELEHDDRFNQQWHREHPGHARRVHMIEAELNLLDAQDTLDTIEAADTTKHPAPGTSSGRGTADELARRRARITQRLDHRAPSVADDRGLGL